ncbi:MAG: MFS transporter, partial [Phyllobacteriaceae bacterium]|nr:MFS transporter [Phyllobacteriaceae bacterium]
PAVYGTITGRVAAPAFWLSAAAPLLVAHALDRGGAVAALAVLAVPAVVATLAAVALRHGAGPH